MSLIGTTPRSIQMNCPDEERVDKLLGSYAQLSLSASTTSHPYQQLAKCVQPPVVKSHISVPQRKPWWGAPLEDNIIECDGNEIITDFSYVSYVEPDIDDGLSSAPGGVPAQILVRQDYDVAYNQMCHDHHGRNEALVDQGCGGLLIMGWKGIGKHTFIRYAMVRLVSEGQPVLFYDGKALHVFRDRTYTSSTPSEYPRLAAEDIRLARCILLCDLPHGRTVPVELRLGYNYIVATLFGDDLAYFQERRCALTFIMQPWPWPEFYAVATSRGLTPDDAWFAYMTYGPTFSFHATPSAPLRDTSSFEAQINSSIREWLSDPRGVMWSLYVDTSELLLRGSPILMPVPSAQFRCDATLVPPSPMVSSILLDALQEREDVEPIMWINMSEAEVLGRLLHRHRSNM